MSDLAYPGSQLVSALLTLLPKLSALLRQIRPDAASWFKGSRQTQLPDKKLLQAKLHEFYLANMGKGEVE